MIDTFKFTCKSKISQKSQDVRLRIAIVALGLGLRFDQMKKKKAQLQV